MNKNAPCCEMITPIYPKNGDTVELTDELVLQFVNGYTVGSSAKYAFRGDCYAPKALKLIWQGRSEKGFKVSIGCEADLSDACTYYIHIQKLRIGKAEGKRGQMKAFAFQIQIFHVVHRRVSANERVFVF